MISSHDLVSKTNLLFLNPRMPNDDRVRFERAWVESVEGKFESQIGIVTSGSTGSSGSLVLLSKDSLKSSALAVNQRLSARKSDTWYKTLPDFHVGGLGIFVRSMLSGSHVIQDRSEKWEPKSFHASLRDSGATLSSLVPTQLFDLVQLGLSGPRSLRAVVIGGGRLEESLRQRARALGWPVLPSYGMTEACSQVATALSPDDPRLVPLNHVEVAISDDGTFMVSGSSLLTAKIVFDGERASLVDPKRNGWFVTEDRGRIETDGSLVVEGRTQDFVKIGGEGVVVSRLEEKLDSLRLKLGIEKDFALLAVRDERLGAKIVLMSTASATETSALREAFDANVAPYEKIRSVHEVAEIPKTDLGKLQRAKASALLGFESASNG